jgi:hypothetical protein
LLCHRTGAVTSRSASAKSISVDLLFTYCTSPGARYARMARSLSRVAVPASLVVASFDESDGQTVVVGCDLAQRPRSPHGHPRPGPATTARSPHSRSQPIGTAASPSLAEVPPGQRCEQRYRGPGGLHRSVGSSLPPPKSKTVTETKFPPLNRIQREEGSDRRAPPVAHLDPGVRTSLSLCQV